MRNLEKLFSKPLPSTRGGSFYNTFPYPTKISPEAIAVYIASATNPDDTVLDAFAGSGSTGIAALLAEHPTEKMQETANALGVEPIWGKRNAILYEIGTYAAFATKTITNRLTAAEYARAVDDFIKKAEKLASGMYAAKSPDGRDGYIRYAIWTEVLICPECDAEIEYFKNGTSRNPATFYDKIECPHCHRTSLVEAMSFATEEHYDKLLKKTILRKKRRIAWVYGTSGKENWDRIATEDDIVDGKLDTSKVMAFKAKAGDVVEVYATTLHYAPCNATKDGCFKVVIALPKGTNGAKPNITPVYDEDKTLWACNKWLLAHAESDEAKQGAYVGLTGENIDIKDII